MVDFTSKVWSVRWGPPDPRKRDTMQMLARGNVKIVKCHKAIVKKLNRYNILIMT